MWVAVGSKMMGKEGRGRERREGEGGLAMGKEKAAFLTKPAHVPGTTPGCFPVNEIDSVWLGPGCLCSSLLCCL